MSRHRPIMVPDDLERRYDGPIPPVEVPAQSDRAGRERLCRRLAAEQRSAIAGRRLGLSGPGAESDRGLQRAAGRLRWYRDQGAAWAAGTGFE
jgi:hypothetical protein